MNKIVLSIVLAIILVFGINKIADFIYYVENPEKSAYQVASISENNNAEKSITADTSNMSGDIMALLASASISDGKKIFKKCAACHSIAQGGGNKIGPALWGVIGRQSGSLVDYKYSKALIAHKKEWTFEEMNSFLIKPKDWIKGTKMSFAGLKNEKDRASVILYMNAQSDQPLPTQ